MERYAVTMLLIVAIICSCGYLNETDKNNPRSKVLDYTCFYNDYANYYNSHLYDYLSLDSSFISCWRLHLSKHPKKSYLARFTLSADSTLIHMRGISYLISSEQFKEEQYRNIKIKAPYMDINQYLIIFSDTIINIGVNNNLLDFLLQESPIYDPCPDEQSIPLEPEIWTIEKSTSCDTILDYHVSRMNIQENATFLANMQELLDSFGIVDYEMTK